MKSFSWKTILRKIKNLKRSDWLIVLLFGVLILIIAMPTKNSKQEQSKQLSDKEEKTAEETEPVVTQEEYCKNLETELEELLSTMSGAGQVKVMITLKNDGEKVLDKNISTDEDSYVSSTVVYQYADEEGPYITSSILPEVEGVVVVAEGGDDAVVCTNILNAVMSLFPVEAHKITIVKMSVSEGAN